MNKWSIALIAAVMVTASAFWWFQPEQVLKRRTHSLMELMTFDGNPGAGVMDVYALGALLSDPVLIDVESIDYGGHWVSRSDCESAYSRLCDHAKDSQFEVLEFRSIEVGDETAEVKVRMRALIELPGIRMLDDEGELTFLWVLEKPHWRLREIHW